MKVDEKRLYIRIVQASSSDKAEYRNLAPRFIGGIMVP
jgi:hypothetical protein